MVVLGAPLVGRLVGFLVVILVVSGCSTQVGPDDPKMSPGDEAKLRENTMTPEQQKAREARPR